MPAGPVRKPHGSVRIHPAQMPHHRIQRIFVHEIGLCQDDEAGEGDLLHQQRRREPQRRVGGLRGGQGGAGIEIAQQIQCIHRDDEVPQLVVWMLRQCPDERPRPRRTGAFHEQVRRRRSSVVFPEPRNPQRTVMGMGGMFGAFIMNRL